MDISVVSQLPSVFGPLWDSLAGVFVGPVGAWLALLGVDIFLGTVDALKTGTWKKEKALNFVEKQLASLGAIAIAVTALSVFVTDGSPAAWAFLLAATVFASKGLVKDIKDKLFKVAQDFGVSAS